MLAICSIPFPMESMMMGMDLLMIFPVGTSLSRTMTHFHTLTRGYGTHGEGVARSAAAEGGDGGDIGVCPNCSYSTSSRE